MIIFGIRSKIRNLLARPHRDALLIFGFPKSGTSAIAGLLAERTGKSVTIDTRYLWEPYLSGIRSGEIDFKKHVNKFAYPFSKQIIKEPNFLYVLDELPSIFKLDKYIYIYRDPFDVVRSVLSRLGIPGDLETAIPREEVDPRWHTLLFDGPSDNHIENIAHRWKYSQDLFASFTHGECLRVDYADFIANKIGTIDSIAEFLDWPAQNQINHLLEKPFQPRGKHTQTDVKTFLGTVNYERIALITEYTTGK